MFPWSTVLSEKMIAAWLVQKVPLFSARRKIIYRAVLKKNRSLDRVYSFWALHIFPPCSINLHRQCLHDNFNDFLHIALLRDM
jgi:hypothetical protein